MFEYTDLAFFWGGDPWVHVLVSAFMFDVIGGAMLLPNKFKYTNQIDQSSCQSTK